ncbi:MAG: hypothetical protein GY903_31280 [Fuerstiella sp.]|nr:hypothetical protein [Fuerstiella sp.]MCP4858976.1 hypothetical protein [Fuerstiella sp.]
MRTAASVCLGAVLFGGPIFSLSSQAEESQWKVGFSRVRITPDQPVRMSGYASRKEPSSGVASDLFAKAMVLEDGAGRRGVIVTTDLIGFRSSVAESTCALIMDRTGLQRNQILINSSHTHTGPALELDSTKLDFPEAHAAATLQPRFVTQRSFRAGSCRLSSRRWRN